MPNFVTIGSIWSVKSWSSVGSSFQTLAPACEKHRSPNLSRIVSGSYRLVSADLSRFSCAKAKVCAFGRRHAVPLALSWFRWILLAGRLVAILHSRLLLTLSVYKVACTSVRCGQLACFVVVRSYLSCHVTWPSSPRPWFRSPCPSTQRLLLSFTWPRPHPSPPLCLRPPTTH